MSRPESGNEVRLSAQQARNLHLAVQGLLTPPRARASRARVLAAVERMRLLQIDTIHVVARSPYLALFSRLGAYEPRWLDELLARGKVFECWAHEACFAPMADFALHRHPSPIRSGHWAHKHAATARREHRHEIEELIAHIRVNGAAKSADFERAGKGGGWWNRSPEKRWLETAFAQGDLMIARRENFQRVYDLAERVLENAAVAIAAPRLPEADIRREFVLGAVRALGIAQARWIADYFRVKACKDADLQPHVDSGELIRIEVRGWKHPAYVQRDNAALLARARRSALLATHTTLLSPFDPVVWDRERASTMFGFDYRIECYTPAPRRRYGYFVLPILHRGRLIGRLDAKAHRADGMFEVKSLHLEAGITPDAALTADVAQAVGDCAAWHGTPRVNVRQSDPAAFAKALRKALPARNGSA
ncbi:MAG: YcaQ family DNA glycosylase [Proteobacteria bacterium]|nr:YcaQ family DNA glycosylase [Pseudomonadota bacterium]